MYDERINNFEKCHIIGQRAEQIGAGAPTLVEIKPEDTSLSLAEREFAEKKIPIIVVRKFPNGTETKKKIYQSTSQ